MKKSKAAKIRKAVWDEKLNFENPQSFERFAKKIKASTAYVKRVAIQFIGEGQTNCHRQ